MISMPISKHAFISRSLTAEQLVAVEAARGIIDCWQISADELARAGIAFRHASLDGEAGDRGSKRTPKSQLTPELKLILRQCRQLANFWTITAEDLRAAKAPERSRVAIDRAQLIRSSAKSKHSAGARSYRHPITQEVWDGHGAQPEWLKLALTREGYTVRELLAPDKTISAP